MPPQFVYVMKGLGKVYPPDTRVLNDIWLSFLPGAKIGVLGLNGAGKSTLLKIMRATNLLPQVEQPRRFRIAAVRDATVLIVWGFFKKLVIADTVGVIANKVFALQAPEFPVLWAGVFAFAIQIYADFSAYTDIARGVATWYGFDLIRNFARPYLATGPADFWHRWNISLSTWFRDYVFIPLGGSRRRPGRVAVNVMVTFLASGFWHELPVDHLHAL